MTQLTLDGVPARCEYVEAEAVPHRNVPCQLACTLAPHDPSVAHVLEWMPLPSTPPALVVIQGGRL